MRHAGAGQTDFAFLLETKVSPSIGLLGLVNIDLSGLLQQPVRASRLQHGRRGPCGPGATRLWLHCSRWTAVRLIPSSQTLSLLHMHVLQGSQPAFSHGGLRQRH